MTGAASFARAWRALQYLSLLVEVLSIRGHATLITHCTRMLYVNFQQL